MTSAENYPLVKLAVRGVDFDWQNKSDGSISNSVIIRDLQALNSRPVHAFAEILAKYEGAQEHELAQRDLFLCAFWVVLPSVGGISIIEKLELHVHPVFLQLEHHVGQEISQYIFGNGNSRLRKNQRDDDSSSSKNGRSSKKITGSSKDSSRSSLHPGMYLTAASRSQESIASYSSNGSDASSARSGRRRSSVHPSGSAISLLGGKGYGGELIRSKNPLADEDELDVEEMKERAKANRTFVLVNFSPTVICLSFKQKASGKSSIKDVYGLVYRTPTFTYRSQTWSYYDLWQAARKEIMTSVLRQGGSLISQVLTTARNQKNFARTNVRRLHNGPKGLLKFGSSSSKSDNVASITEEPTSPLHREVTRSSTSSHGGQSAAKVPPPKIDREDPPYVVKQKHPRYTSQDGQDSPEQISDSSDEGNDHEPREGTPRITLHDATPRTSQSPWSAEDERTPSPTTSPPSSMSRKNPLRALRQVANNVLHHNSSPERESEAETKSRLLLGKVSSRV